jgi:hypothetical protein
MVDLRYQLPLMQGIFGLIAEGISIYLKVIMQIFEELILLKELFLFLGEQA